MPHACKISEVIELLQQYQNDGFVLCSLWYEDDMRNVDDSVTTEEARAAYAMQPAITMQNRALTGSHWRPHLTPSDSKWIT
ncbi:hypothetical protein N5C39_14665 [Enterobacter bugandensis]|uniref:Uncharacterized protein n=1 Tax=Enterobacter bugandensis TaxID=881260 RepID=A0AA42PRX9_9ENTR|nr:hypothetical protein [Enterobacter bugandensis]MDH1319611.1 hypothetical protein [Enterobacter bugandensis]